MELMTSRWTDGRMNDLKDQVDALSRRTDEGFRDLRGEIGELRTEMASRFTRFEARFDAMDARFDAMQRVLIMFGASMFAAMMGIIVTLIAFQL